MKLSLASLTNIPKTGSLVLEDFSLPSPGFINWRSLQIPELPERACGNGSLS